MHLSFEKKNLLLLQLFYNLIYSPYHLSLYFLILPSLLSYTELANIFIRYLEIQRAGI